jgi:hypothetical protein
MSERIQNEREDNSRLLTSNHLHSYTTIIVYSKSTMDFFGLQIAEDFVVFPTIFGV